MILVGFVIVALPDSDKRLFSISKGHGPSLLDSVGLILILVFYLWLIRDVWKNRSRLKEYYKSVLFKISSFLCIPGMVLILVSLLNDDYSGWWIYGTIILVLIQIPVFYTTLR